MGAGVNMQWERERWRLGGGDEDGEYAVGAGEAAR